MQNKKTILCIGHEASLTGAPILLLNLLNCLKEDFKIIIVLKRGGDIENHFISIATTYILKHKNYSSEKNIIKKVIDRIIYFFKQLSIIIPYSKADYVLSNTVCNGRLLKRFNLLKKPIVTYVHELESMLQYFNEWNDTKYSLELSSKILFPSKAVQENLIQKHQVHKNKTQYLPYYFPQKDFDFEIGDKLKSRKAFFQKWFIPENAFLIVGMGMVSERKGTKHFVDVAKEVIKHSKNIYFIWIGDFSDELSAQNIKNEYYKNTESSNILFTGKLPYSTQNLLAFDLFFLSSVEDPYPLVVLEAAYQYVPSLCYNNSGGITEFIANDFGFNIAYDNVVVTAKKIVNISEQKTHLGEMAQKVRSRVLDLHSNKEQIIETFKNAIEDL